MRSRSTTLLLLLLAATLPLSAQWRYVGEMHVARTEPALTPLKSGLLLASGGLNDRGYAEGSCELFDPASWSWRMTTPMHIPRGRHVALPLPDGRVAVIAGYTGSLAAIQLTGSVEIYDPATESWSAAGSLILPRMNFTATLLPNGTILVAGGYNPSQPEPYLDQCEIYDPRTGQSRLTAKLKTRRMDHQTVILNDGSVLLAGGRIGGSNGIFLNEAEVYDPGMGTWRVIDPMGAGRISGFTLDRFPDGAVLVAGGRSAPETSTTQAQLLGSADSRWESVAPMHLPRVWHAGAVISGTEYIATGGFVNASWHTNSAIELTATCELFDRGRGEWFMLPSLNTPRSQHAMVHLRVDHGLEDPADVVMVAGGRMGDNISTNTTEVLDVSPYAIKNYISTQKAGVAPSAEEEKLWMSDDGSVGSSNRAVSNK